MTSQSPRIYIYKITFDEVLYYYYGVHKEKKFGEYYMGSPVTHKWCWELYTPKKQILEFFDFTEEGWLEAQEVEKRIIKPIYQIDQWCLNENCGGLVSLEMLRENGKKLYEQGIGFHSLTTEQRRKNGRKSGKMQYENKLGIHKLTPEQIKQNSKKGTSISIEKRSKEFALISPKGEIVRGKNIENFCRKNNLNSSHISRVLNGKLNYHKGWRKYSKETKEKMSISFSQRWECCETGFVSNASGLTRYQKARNIDNSKRKRLS
tara:strand:+ start:155 stop:943 length:789 start_codon:yes stop_codon:yes gene_type:complete